MIGPVVVSSQDALGSTQTQVLGVTGGTSGQVSDVSLGLVDVATVVVVRAPYLVTDRLSFGERTIGSVLHPGAKAGVAADTLTFVDAACRSQVPTSADALLFTNAATVAAAKAIHDALTLVDVATAIHVGGVGAIDALSLQESVAFVLVHGDPRWVYTPFVGTGAAGNPTPPGPLVGPTEGIGTCRFVYPTTSPTVTVPLRSPEFGNKDRLQFNRISRESRGGTLVVFADPMWPKVETQVLTFIGLSFTQSQVLLTSFGPPRSGSGLRRLGGALIGRASSPIRLTPWCRTAAARCTPASLEFECQLPLGSHESAACFKSAAPYRLLQTTTLLPIPQFGDQEANLDTVSRKLAMDGTRYTYVKRRGGRRKLRWIFQLSRNKGLELRAFIQSYFASADQGGGPQRPRLGGQFHEQPVRVRHDGHGPPGDRADAPRRNAANRHRVRGSGTVMVRTISSNGSERRWRNSLATNRSTSWRWTGRRRCPAAVRGPHDSDGAGTIPGKIVETRRSGRRHRHYHATTTPRSKSASRWTTRTARSRRSSTVRHPQANGAHLPVVHRPGLERQVPGVRWAHQYAGQLERARPHGQDHGGSQIEDKEIGFSAEEGKFPYIPSDLVGKAWPMVFGTVYDYPALHIPFGVSGITLQGVGILTDEDAYLNSPLYGNGTNIDYNLNRSMAKQMLHWGVLNAAAGCWMGVDSEKEADYRSQANKIMEQLTKAANARA